MNSEQSNYSEFRGQAAEVYLSALAQSSGLRAVALADRQGLLVAGAGDPEVVERLAAIGATSDSDKGSWRELLEEIADGCAFSTRSVTLGELECQLSVLGASEPLSDEICRNLDRILLQQ